MKREVMKKLCHWYDSCDERLLFLAGAPWVGKTWLIENLCEEKHERYVIISANQQQFDDVDHAGVIVITDVNDKRALERAKKIIFMIRNEERLGCFRIIIESRLVGDRAIINNFLDEKYVNYVRVYPLNITEFAAAFSDKGDYSDEELLRMYLYVGGMPECVSCVVDTGSLQKVRGIQKRLLNALKDSYS